MAEVQVLGDYLLIEQIGTGGMARTYKALSTRASTHVCLKLLHPHLADDEHNVRMFIDEANICRELNHPNIVKLFDVGQIDGAWFIAFELIIGTDLKTAIDDARARRIPVAPILCAEIALGVLRALDYIHNKQIDGQQLNIIHRDVTPHNVMLAFDGSIKLTDFGVAKAAFRLAHTATGAIKGKYGYMSPEQLRDKDIDARSDIFAVGILLHELLTGRHLFQGDSPYITLANLVSMPIHPPSDFNHRCDEALDRIVLRALQRDIDARWPSARAMLQALERWVVERNTQGQVADIGAWMRELYDVELDRSERPRRLTSEELAAMVSPMSMPVFRSANPTEPAPIDAPAESARPFRRRDASDDIIPVFRSEDIPRPRITRSLTGERAELPSREVFDLSAEIPVDFELDPENTPSRELSRRSLGWGEPLPPGVETTATNPLLTIPAEDATGARRALVDDPDATLLPPPPAPGLVPALPPGARLPSHPILTDITREVHLRNLPAEAFQQGDLEATTMHGTRRSELAELPEESSTRELPRDAIADHLNDADAPTPRRTVSITPEELLAQLRNNGNGRDEH